MLVGRGLFAIVPLYERGSSNLKKREISCPKMREIYRPLNLPGQFIVRATHFHSEIGQSHSEIPAQSSHNARFGGTK